MQIYYIQIDKSKMKFALIPISIILLLSCTEHHRKKQIGQLFSTEIILPDTSSLFNKALDSINLNIPAKMVVYFDAETCASCALSRIWEWDEVSHITQASNGKYQTLFIFTPKQRISRLSNVSSKECTWRTSWYILMTGRILSPIIRLFRKTRCFIHFF